MIFMSFFFDKKKKKTNKLHIDKKKNSQASWLISQPLDKHA